MKQAQLMGVRGALLRPCGLPHGGRVPDTKRQFLLVLAHPFPDGKGESAPHLGAGETEINPIGSLTSKEEGWSGDHWGRPDPTEQSYRRGGSAQGTWPQRRGSRLRAEGVWPWGWWESRGPEETTGTKAGRGGRAGLSGELRAALRVNRAGGWGMFWRPKSSFLGGPGRLLRLRTLQQEAMRALHWECQAFWNYLTPRCPKSQREGPDRLRVPQEAGGSHGLSGGERWAGIGQVAGCSRQGLTEAPGAGGDP